MQPGSINSLKAGVKTAVIVFITAMLGVLTLLGDALVSWATEGNPPDLSVLKGTAVAAVLAAVIGLVNTLLRLAQAHAVPLVSTLLDKLLGSIPDYLPPAEGPVDNLVDAAPGVNPKDDAGYTTLTTVLIVLAIIVCVVLLIKFVDVNVQ